MHPCPSCGEPDAAGAACERCGAALLADVVLQGALPTDRERFLAARALAALGPPAPSFAEARELLSRRGGTLVSRVSRPFAQRAVAAVGEHGVRASLVAPDGKAPRLDTVARVGVVHFLGVVAVLGAIWLAPRAWELISTLRSPPAAAPDASGAAPSPARAPSSVDPRAPATATSPAAAAAPAAALSLADLTALILPSVVAIRCPSSVGAGFFIDAETVLTNAHVACREGETTKVRLRDGRELLGRTALRDDWLDVARVEVAGAAGKPLPIGDSTVVRPGDPLLLVGSPRGLDFTLHEGRASFVGRAVQGIGYLQINASVNPGNSGGPLLDTAGRVVGIVSLQVLDAEGIGLALPIEYAQPPGDAKAKARWDALLAAVKDEDDKLRAQVVDQTQKPFLVGTTAAGERGLGALVVQRFEGGPHAQTHLFELRIHDSWRCTVKAEFSSWLSLAEAAKQHQRASRGLQWLLLAGGGRDLYVGAAPIDFEGCPKDVEVASSVLAFRDGAEVRGSARLDPEEVRNARALAQQQKVKSLQRSASAAASRERAEEVAASSWRLAFNGARARIASAQAAVLDGRRLLQSSSSMVHAALYQQRTLQLSRSEAELSAAQARLRDLERRAALEAVPLEWRR